VQLNAPNIVRCKGNATRGTINNFKLFMAQVNFFPSCVGRSIDADAISSCILVLNGKKLAVGERILIDIETHCRKVRN